MLVLVLAVVSVSGQSRVRRIIGGASESEQGKGSERASRDPANSQTRSQIGNWVARLGRRLARLARLALCEEVAGTRRFWEVMAVGEPGGTSRDGIPRTVESRLP